MNHAIKVIATASFILMIATPLAGVARSNNAASVAEQHVGQREGTSALNKWLRINTRIIPWCAAFLRSIHKRPPSNSLAVSGWDGNHVGPVVSTPRRGDIAFWRHRHIGIVTSYRNGIVCTVSGNRSNKVTKSCEPRRKFRRFRRVK